MERDQKVEDPKPARRYPETMLPPEKFPTMHVFGVLPEPIWGAHMPAASMPSASLKKIEQENRESSEGKSVNSSSPADRKRFRWVLNMARVNEVNSLPIPELKRNDAGDEEDSVVQRWPGFVGTGSEVDEMDLGLVERPQKRNKQDN